MRDFSYEIYRRLIEGFKSQGYGFQSLGDFVTTPLSRSVILRHDIDITAVSALRLAVLENQNDVYGSYYFRTTKHSFNTQIIKEVARLGHEIGYHYEDLTRHGGNMEQATQDFGRHLAMFREVYPVRTVCMHGRSGSPYDNRDIWKEHELEKFGIIAEPYISLDFNKVLYLSDTTQKWDGDNIAVRDRVQSTLGLSFRTTRDILDNIDKLPNHVMITIHPELWTKNLPGWLLAKLFVLTHGAYKRYYRNPKTQKKLHKLSTRDLHE